MEDILTKFNKIIEDFRKLNDFVVEMFNDKRISNEIRDEYADKYNALKIHKLD